MRVKNLTDDVIAAGISKESTSSPKSSDQQQQQVSPDGAEKAKIGIAIKKSPNSDSSFESRLLDQDDDDPMDATTGSSTSAATKGTGAARGASARPSKADKDEMATPTGPKSKKVGVLIN